MIWLEIKYLNLISFNLNHYKLKSTSPFKSTFRCPYCGDSKKSKTKARGNIYEVGGHLSFNCFNCDKKRNISGFIRDMDPNIYKDYKLELLKESGGPTWQPKIEKTPMRRVNKFNPLKHKLVKCISSLSHDHPAKEYINKRLIPPYQHFRLYYTPKFFTWVNHFLPDKFNEASLKSDHPRLVLPMIDSEGYVFGVQGRSFDPKDEFRYITIMFDDSKPKIFGLDQANMNEVLYVVEGPIDSLFLKNSIAMAGLSPARATYLNSIIILDNEPRNEDVVKKIHKYIESDYKVCIWPDYIKEKDINDMVLNGYDPKEIQKIIDNNTYSGLEARVQLNYWKKI